MTDDASLLRRFVQQHANDAFAELVRRHLNLVYFAALRQTDGDTHRAEDASQSTFTFLAQKAGSLLAHPNLAGWLHTVACHHARDLNRSEHRRLQREQTAHVMHELTSAEANDETWTQVRPIIDDAMQDLTPDDREAVLLRFFENRPFAEIGAELQLSENAARMRITRALEQLETALARRGVKSTSAALATVLAIPAAMAAPTGLANTFSATALTATTLVGTAATTLNVFKIMFSAKLIATATSLAALVAISTAIYQHKQLQSFRNETTALRQQQSELQAQLATEKKRADTADADNGRLLAVMAATRTDQNKSAAPQVPLTEDMVMKRHVDAQVLTKNGRYEEALKEFLWCYDTGMPQVSSLAESRGSFLLEGLGKLAKNYPPAFAALQERRTNAEQRLQANPSDTVALSEYANLNRSLGETDKTLTFFSSLPTDDKRRKSLVYYVRDQLIEARRYTELIQARSASRLINNFTIMAYGANVDKMSPDQLQGRATVLANNTATDIEALAGAGDLPHASKLIGSLLEFDNSAETRATIQTHLARAGHPELLKAP